MALLVPNSGEGVMLNNIVNKTAPSNLTLKLYKSNTTPGEADTAATYTEADFTGYSAASLTGSSWTVTTGAPSYASYAQQTFTSSATQSAQSIYGYFVVNAAGTLMWAEKFTDGPYSISNNGDAVKVTPYIELA